jgi:antitoxin PrlF
MAKLLLRLRQQKSVNHLNRFLDFLSQDIADYPERLRAIDDSLAHRLRSLIGSIDVDLNAPLHENDE